MKIVVTGPESSGKSTLSAALALALKAPMVPEFARPYLQYLGRPYRHCDLESIGRGQRAWEDWFAAHYTANHLILDTDWTVLQIWETWKYRTTPPCLWQKGYGHPHAADLYLLCSPDFPWQPDPLRENPDDRTVLFDLYEHLLLKNHLKYHIIAGAPNVRLQTAIRWIMDNG